MVVDMLTSAEEQVPLCVAPIKEDSSATHCPSVTRHGDCRPADVPDAHDLQSSNRPGRSSASGSLKMNRGVDSLSSERHYSTESQEDGDEGRHRQPTDKSTRSCKRKLDLTSLCLDSGDATKAEDSGNKGSENPPPAKRWVIGPLFQSFKSKMASFTEIVMSPARLFKPNELPARTGTEFLSDGSEEKKQRLKKEQTKSAVVQRLIFDTDSINGRDSEQNKAAVPQNGAEPRREDGSFGSSNSTCSKSTNQIREVVRDFNMERGSRDDKQNCESRTAGPVEGKNSVRTRFKKCSGRTEQTRKGTSQTQDQPLPLPRELRQTSSAVRKRKKARRPERSGLAEMVEEEDLAKQEEESPSDTQTLENPTLILTLKRRKGRISDECVVLGAGDVRTWASSRMTRQRKNNEERKSDATESCIRQANHKSVTSATSSAKKAAVCKKRRNMRRDKRAADDFEDQGMSMSLTLKVGSGLDGKTDSRSIMTCGITAKGKKRAECVTLANTSCPARMPHEERFCAKDADVDVEKTEADQQRGWLVYSEIREEELEQEDDAKPGLTSSGAIQLTRSLSCPDITSLRHGSDATAAPVRHERHPDPPSPLKNVPQLIGDASSQFKRPRRHTVCSMEIEREIAPLCLRKEVYPKWSTSHHSHTHSSTSPSASLVCGFLSSPLAFLSKKSSRGHGDDSGYGASSSSSDLAAVESSPSSSPSPLNSLAFSRTASGSAFFADGPLVRETSFLSSNCSVFDAGDGGVAHQDSDEIQRPSAAAEEKALSDSEIKTDNKQEKRRKVSSIRIRKTLPKPQNNLTPMGLPKAVRIKKKVFSVEEIYTNKNFTKPPEGRLETIFEVPVSRRDGSHSLVGPKRVKRFLEFPEVGVARKPKKPLVGGAGGGGAPRKASGNPGTGRTRRCRKAGTVELQDLDSILCSKLEELDVWMSSEQMN